jgi:uncharacterized protein (DUF924 family)
MGNTDFSADFAGVLDFWFGTVSDRIEVAEGSRELRCWFGKDDALDAEIRARFEPLHRRLAAAVRSGWQPATIEDALAAIIVLDQFPRNMFRGTPGMYATDPEALVLSRAASARPEVQTMDLFRASFLHMPLMHAEILADQKAVVACFRRLDERARREASPNQPYFEKALWFADRHREIVAKFGRFPHRNAILGRATTREEAEFLKEEHSSF